MQRKRHEAEGSKLAKQAKVAPGSRPTMGRPPLPREVARCERVVTFVNKPEKASLELLADATSLYISGDYGAARERLESIDVSALSDDERELYEKLARKLRAWRV